MNPTRLSVAALAAAATVALPSAAHGAERTKPRTIAVDVAVDGFGMKRGKPVAYATARTVAYNRSGQLRQSKRRTTLAVSSAKNGCKILTLHIDELKLTLLGLTVDTSSVNLEITGQKSGTLGRLFCQLASGLKLKDTLRTRAAVRSLDRSVKRKKLRTFSFRAVAHPTSQPRQAAPAQSCAVLDLTLGPVRLDLLGLNVDLYGPTRKDPVKVTITANPEGGVLGKLFCELANNAQANSTA